MIILNGGSIRNKICQTEHGAFNERKKREEYQAIERIFIEIE